MRTTNLHLDMPTTNLFLVTRVPDYSQAGHEGEKAHSAVHCRHAARPPGVSPGRALVRS